MIACPLLRASFRVALLASLFIAGAAAGPMAATGQAVAASEIKLIVNKEPVTTFQIKQRAAFLKLRHVKGDPAAMATEELIDEALKKQEVRRRGITISDAAVDQSFERFASENKITTAQLGQVLAQAGFSDKAFKAYIKIQMGWGQAVQASMRSADNRLSEADVVQRMLSQGGDKPSTTEYTLQQVIFVIPEAKRAALKDERLREANALRGRFRTCPENYEFAKGLRDVTIRELGRVAQPALPDRWKDAFATPPKGGTTAAKETERGIEYLAICDTRTISDDKVAAMVFQTQDLEKLGKVEPDAKLLKQLRDKASIVRR